MTTETLTFNLSFFRDNFEEFKQHFDNGSGHPEFFYCNFYYEFIRGDEDKLFTAEEQSSWKEEWILALNDEELKEMSFEEIIEQEDYLYEDLTEWVINSNLPQFSELKEKFIAQMFFYISEKWSKEEIADSIKSIKEENN
ncbi:hypothetical protein OAE23_02495 [Synechococcus sp. AH-551-E11]|nr:hypothetical protein [Synechococcus sp. AH-551-E11]MDB4616949.1 hypothetical protein [Synechococcus sp. AH-551-E11]